MKFHCKICNRSFKKFVLFEGHFESNIECREKHQPFIQCYICFELFRNYSALKYHISYHTVNRVKRLIPVKKRQVAKKSVSRPVIPKITLKKQWHFKEVPQDAGAKTRNGQLNCAPLECKICREKFRSLFHLAQHSKEHETTKQGPISPETTPPNDKRKSEGAETVVLSVPSASTTRPPNPNQCSVCNIVLKYGGERLVRHMQHHIDGKYKCEICNIKFSMVSLIWHQRYFHKMHSRTKTFSTKRRLKKHHIKKGNTKKGRCNICQAVVKRCSVQHMQNHKTGKFKCNICNIRFSKLSFIWHQRRFHPDIPQRMPGKQSCQICNAVLADQTSLKKHLLIHDTGEVKCDPCNIRFTPLTLALHQKKFHQNLPRQLARKRSCKICNAVLADHTSLRRHLHVHEIGEVKCDLCNIRFTPNSLLKHQKEFHPDLPTLLSVRQSCNICKTICHSKAALDQHAIMHANGEYKCEQHQIKFTFDALQIHNNRWHNKERSMCPICKFSFKDASHLERHKKVHVIGSVKCEICDIPFTSNSLVHHQKVFHSELYHGVFDSERQNRKSCSSNIKARRQTIVKSQQFQCTYCKLCFYDAKTLETHTAVHVDGDVECRICKVRFTKNSLAFHEKRFHPEEIRKERILKALHRHLSDELQGLDDLDPKDIPAILEDQYQQLTAGNPKYQCIICKVTCGDGKKLGKHITVHIEGDYKCEICSVWFTKNSLDFHQKRFHPEVYEERISNGIKLTKERCDEGTTNEFSEKTNVKLWRLRCEICKICIGGAERMEEHKQTHITGDAECKVCNIRFTVNALRYHQRTYHPSDYKPESKQYKCTVCRLEFSESSKLDTHMTVHTEADTQCDICNIPFTAPSLRYHMRRFHSNETSTELLQRALERNMIEISTNALNQMIRSQCPICKVKCEGKGFDAHMKVHIDGDVQCSVCQTWFTQTSLDYHYKRFHPDLHVAKENRNETQFQCNVCKLVWYDESRLKEHMKVHAGNVKCPICNIPFTKPSLVYHYKRFHPNLTKQERILKPIENSVPRKNLHNCPKCGKSFTRICYLKLHIKHHRNGVEPVEIPFADSGQLDAELVEIPFAGDSELCAEAKPAELQPSLPSSPLTVEVNYHSVSQSAAIVKTRNYECYVCKEPYKTAYQLQDHLSKHVVYEQWVDPSNVYLSNWDADELREIILEQPIVLARNLDVRTIDLKMLADFDRPTENSIDKGNDINENFAETDLPDPPLTNDVDYVAPDTTQNDCDDIVEILSESDDDCETIQYQLNNNAKQLIQPEFMETENSNNEPVYISSDDEDDYNGDITDTFYCYYCNGQFLSMAQYGVHEKICRMKHEPIV